VLDRTIPVTPPAVNILIKPKIHRYTTPFLILPPAIVIIQLKILIPVGTAITIVAIEKYDRESKSIPTVNI
jgi:hypothetical protein